MVSRVLAILLQSCIAVVIAKSFTPRANTTLITPCTQVSNLALSRGRGAIIDAQLALECLSSVPLKAKEALDLMEAMMPFVELQSTIEYLKAPPPSYWYPPLDLRARFKDIMSNISTGSYPSEYAFQAQVLKVYNLARDGHFRFIPDLLSRALLFERPDNMTLVSVSLDGVLWPRLYIKNEQYSIENTANISTADIDRMAIDAAFRPSPLRQINGQDAHLFVEDLSMLGSSNDPDAAYNLMFYSPSFQALAGRSANWKGYFGGTGVSSLIYPGPDTTLTFENGTTWTARNVARIVGNFTGITDGESMYQRFCTGPVIPAQPTTVSVSPTSSSTASIMPSNSAVPTALPVPMVVGYPQPVIVTSDAEASGYYLLDSDVAVLSFRTFSADVPVEWQMTTQKFLAAAKADGKTKLIVDLQSNTGGLIFTGYDTFRQLFPQIVQDGNTRFRNAAPFQELAVDVNTALPPEFNPQTSDNTTLITIALTPLNYEFDLDINNQTFPSVEAKFAKVIFQQDAFTPINRWDASSSLITRNDTFGIGMDITGYNSRQNFTQPFAAEDIIMIQDGFCASTCTIFAEFMRTQAGVRTIAMGGRTPQTGSLQVPQIQGIGGTKGANNFAFSVVAELTQLTLDALRSFGLGAANETLLRSLANTLPQRRSTSATINVRDNILKDNLEDGTPAQFIYEPADCRLFYTPAMMQNITAIWQAAAKAAWGGGACNAGGLSNGTSSRGNSTIPKFRRGQVKQRDMGQVVRMSGISTKDRSLAWKEMHIARVQF